MSRKSPSGGQYINVETANLYASNNWNQLPVALKAIALGECGGTLTLQTRLERDGGIGSRSPYQNSEQYAADGTKSDDRPEDRCGPIGSSRPGRSTSRSVKGCTGRSSSSRRSCRISAPTSREAGPARRATNRAASSPSTFPAPSPSPVEGHPRPGRGQRGGLLHPDRDPAMSADTAPEVSRDEGSALILVLVLMVIGSLIVLPVLNFTMAVNRHNTVLSEKTKRQEAVKAGLRTALADPSQLFEHCFNEPRLADPGITGVPISNRCEFIDFAWAENEADLHLGLAATRVGERIPDDLMAIVEKDALGNPVLGPDGKPKRFVFSPSTSAIERVARSGAVYAINPTALPKRIWAPNLPVHGLSNGRRSATRCPTGTRPARCISPAPTSTHSRSPVRRISPRASITSRTSSPSRPVPTWSSGWVNTKDARPTRRRSSTP